MLDQEITRQARIIAFVDDFKLMLVLAIIALPLLLLTRPAGAHHRSRRSGGSQIVDAAVRRGFLAAARPCTGEHGARSSGRGQMSLIDVLLPKCLRRIRRIVSITNNPAARSRQKRIAR